MKTKLIATHLRDRLDKTRLSALELGTLQPITTTLHTVEQHGIFYQVHILCSPRRKPSGFRGDNKHTNPFLPYEKSLCVGHLNTEHIVLLNKYNVVDNHFLIITPEFEPQEALLSPLEFAAIYEVMQESSLLVFYNSGLEAGASQPHRHVQAIPAEDIPINTLIKNKRQLPFRSELILFPDGVIPTQETLYQSYTSLLIKLQLWTPDSTALPLPHNLLITSEWMLVVPRKKGKHPLMAVNALGFAGLMLVKNRERFETLKEQGPESILQEV